MNTELDPRDFKEPTCHNCKSLAYCTVGRKNGVENCTMKKLLKFS